MQIDWKKRAIAAADVVAVVRSGTNVFLHGACVTPAPLTEALSARRDLADVRLYHLHGQSLRERGEALISIADPDMRAELARDLAEVRHFPVSNPTV